VRAQHPSRATIHFLTALKSRFVDKSERKGLELLTNSGVLYKLAHTLCLALMVSIGEELKREREYREISLREISDATKINIRMLEAIEKDNFGALPGGIFIRNFIRAYAQFIGLDPEVIIRKYQVQTGLDQEPPEPAKLPPNLMVPTSKDRKRITKPQLISIFVVTVTILLILLLLVWKYPDKIPLRKKADSTSFSFLQISAV
jgi:cytoskeletal protein RodZ